MNKVHAFILAGGVGSRFWPMSTPQRPKQFLDILGTGRSLIRQTVDRYRQLLDEDRIWILTNEDYIEQVAQHTGLPKSQILTEPMRRNTAPCIAYASHLIKSIDPEAVMVVAPSDHLILDESRFKSRIEQAVEAAEKGAIVTLGLKPSRPDTGYGYIHFDGDNTPGTLHDVIEFVEKPDLEKAQQYLEAGTYFWNAGIFIWKAGEVIGELERFEPEISSLFAEVNYQSDDVQEQVDSAFENSKSISIDYAVLERSDKVQVVLSDFGWSDLGTWGSMYEHMDKDADGNCFTGETAIWEESKGNLVRLPKGKTAIISGLEDFIVVDQDDKLLIVPRSEEQRIKDFSQKLEG